MAPRVLDRPTILTTKSSTDLIDEFLHAIVIDSFWISILTAILLKLLLDALKGVEHAVAGYSRAREGAVYKVLGIYEKA